MRCATCVGRARVRRRSSPRRSRTVTMSSQASRWISGRPASHCEWQGSYGCLDTLKVPEFCVGIIKHFEVLDLSTVLESA